MSVDILNPDNRVSIIEQIENDENINRKDEHFKRNEIFNSRQKPYVIDRLAQEFALKTVQEMRTITSINLTERIVKEEASVYREEPVRLFSDTTDDDKEYINKIYDAAMANIKFKWSNRRLKLHDQNTIQWTPRNGKIQARVLAPHQYDVIPQREDPTKADVYILNVVDRDRFLDIATFGSNRFGTAQAGSPFGPNQRFGSNFEDSTIADADDWKKGRMRYVWWSDEFHFMTNGFGMILDENEQVIINLDLGDLINPIGVLPFVDVSDAREFEYWVRNGSAITDFAEDFLVLLSDHFNISRMQGYSQAVISSEKMPENMLVGPNSVMWLQLDPTAQIQPKFEFVTPNPDLATNIQSLEMFLNLFLTSRGQDPALVAVDKGQAKANSGVERLLMMIDKFEATKDDFDKYDIAEKQSYELIKRWNNTLMGTDQLLPEFQERKIPEKSKLEVVFAEPKNIQTKKEVEESVIRLMGVGLMSKKEAIAEIRNISPEQAEEILKELEDSEPSQPEPLEIPEQETPNNTGHEEDEEDG